MLSKVVQLSTAHTLVAPQLMPYVIEAFFIINSLFESTSIVALK